MSAAAGGGARPARALLLTLTLAALLAGAGCRKREEAGTTTVETMVVGRENVAVVTTAQVRTGPALSGTLAPEDEATVRAEVGGAVLGTYAEQGQAVRKGQLLARLDDIALRAQVLSARSGVTTATVTSGNAQREYERNQALFDAGGVAERDLDQARTALTAAQAQLANARAILANAEQLARKTTIAAPFTGVVSARSVSGGDVVTPGTALFTVVNPASMRLEAAVPAEALAQVHVGVSVDFTVSGYLGRSFTGKITRINPVADPTTRQVRVIVSIPNSAGILVGGLFASGQVASETVTAPVIPTSAVDERDAQPFVVRVHGGRAVKTPVQLGIRDVPSETIAIASGVQPGDTVLLGAARQIGDGTPVRVGTPGSTN